MLHNKMCDKREDPAFKANILMDKRFLVYEMKYYIGNTEIVYLSEKQGGICVCV